MAVNRHSRMLIGLWVVAIILLARLFYIQIVDNSYKINASNNSMYYMTIYPARGIIYDRKGEIMVGNNINYDILVTPTEVQEFDTLLFCNALGVSREFVENKMEEYRRDRRKIGFQSVVMLKQVPMETYVKFAEIAYKFPGFRGHERSSRDYPVNAGGNLLGYVSEVDQDYIDNNKGEYRSGDYAGKTGLEAAREKDLRGEKGYEIYLRNSHNKIETRYKNGELDKEAMPGKDIVTTIDAELQRYGQELMQNKVGSLVAIEPSTGEILALISSPGIDVEVLSDFGKHYNEVLNNPYRPMFNRAVQASYPPGSVFKVVNGLIGMQEGVLTPETYYPCYHGYIFGANRLGCHGHKSPLCLEEAVMMSCNAYFCYVFKSVVENPKYKSPAEGLAKWDEYVRSFGFGQPLGSDFPSELGGLIPTPDYYNGVYGNGGWKGNTIISLSIGQGEIGCTPMHLANLCATIANRGYYITPHIVKDSEGVSIDEKYKKKNYTLVDTTYFPVFVNGMYRAVNSGYGSGGTASIAAVKGLDICGKTGTAQNPRGADNSVFICFAPKDNPKIAVAAYVENGGFGATWAAPIASLLVEYYLNGDISSERKYLENRVLTGDLMDRVMPY